MSEPFAVDVRDAAQMVSLSEGTLRKAVVAGELPAIRVGRGLRIETAELLAWSQQQLPPVTKAGE